MKLTPRQNTLAYLAWVKCSSMGWDITPTDLVEHLNTAHHCDTSMVEVNRVVKLCGWTERLAGKTIDKFQRMPPLFTGDAILYGESAENVVVKLRQRGED